MPKHIGIVACSAEGAALCYRTLCTEAPALMGPHQHPEVSLHTFPLGRYMEYLYRDDWDSVGDLMAESARKLASIGAEFCICPDNTIHQVFARATANSPVPWLHIAEVVAEEAVRRGFRHLGVLGTRYLMEGPVYPEKLAPRSLAHSIPGPEQRARINAIIFDELVNGRFLPESRGYLVDVIGGLKQQGCDAVVLGCTEIPLIISDADSPLPTLDSTRLLARAALRKALE
ncbi:MAG TPA: amino acid racemase [Terriglobales bacterium]|nr:amino acid racemase [Terriglobales bacterium]